MEPSSQTPPTVKKRVSLTLVLVILILLLIAAIGAAGYFYLQSTRVAPQPSQADEMKSLIEEIGKSLVLPEGEEPTLATVTDREKLAGQAFFEKAENGDKVLIYASSGRAILYRPSVKKVIDMTTVNINTPVEEPVSTVPVPTTPAEPTATVSEESKDTAIQVSNGGGPRGAAGALAEELKKAGYMAVSTGNTTKDYTGVTIYYGAGLDKEAESLKAVIAKTYPAASLAPALADDPETQTAPLTIILGK